MTRLVRTVLFSTLYPSSVRPLHGNFVENRVRELLKSRKVETRVNAPVKWFPSRHPQWGTYANYASSPKRERRNGVDRSHPCCSLMTMLPVRRRFALVSTVFLLPANAGGKVRSGNLLLRRKGGAFDVTLICPASGNGQDQGLDWLGGALAPILDQVVCWALVPSRRRWTRVVALFRSEPANVCNSSTREARNTAMRALTAGRFDVGLFNFEHATSLMPAILGMGTGCSTHNVETEIFAGHAQQVSNPAMRWVWAAQARKTVRYKRETLARYTSVTAVSARVAKTHAAQAELDDMQTIPIAVALDFFTRQAVAAPVRPGRPTVAFTGSMDQAANIDDVVSFLADIWPRILRSLSSPFVVVSRNAPDARAHQCGALAGLRLTGFVYDVHPHVRCSQAFTISLRAGGGIRNNAIEDRVMGCVVVSTTLGVEGLEVVVGEHLLLRVSAQEQADAIVRLIRELALAPRRSARARQLVDKHFFHLASEQVFERICLIAFQRHGRAPVVIARTDTGISA